MPRKKLNSYLYTCGKIDAYRGSSEDPYLYSKGRYATKITAEDLTDDYVKIRSRVIGYMDGYLKTSGIVDIQYRPTRINHMFKDDFLFISYSDKLDMLEDDWDMADCVRSDFFMCGSDIPYIVLAAKKNSCFDTSDIEDRIEQKRIWFRDKYPCEYAVEVGDDRNIFDILTDRGIV